MEQVQVMKCPQIFQQDALNKGKPLIPSIQRLPCGRCETAEKSLVSNWQVRSSAILLLPRNSRSLFLLLIILLLVHDFRNRVDASALLHWNGVLRDPHCYGNLIPAYSPLGHGSNLLFALTSLGQATCAELGCLPGLQAPFPYGFLSRAVIYRTSCVDYICSIRGITDPT